MMAGDPGKADRESEIEVRVTAESESECHNHAMAGQKLKAGSARKPVSSNH
jgi:hypothetical protein